MTCNTLYVRSTFSDSPGTKITNQKENVFGVACDINSQDMVIVHNYSEKTYKDKMASIVNKYEAIDIRLSKKLIRFNLPGEHYRLSLKEIHNELLANFQ